MRVPHEVEVPHLPGLLAIRLLVHAHRALAVDAAAEDGAAAPPPPSRRRPSEENDEISYWVSVCGGGTTLRLQPPCQRFYTRSESPGNRLCR